MRKSTWLMLVCIVMAVTMAIGGTLAYLTDTDEAVNTMVMGNVDIEMNEYADAAHTKPFGDGETLLPGDTMDKHVVVENIGSTDAYVRTWVALEQGVENKRVLPVWNGVSAVEYSGNPVTIGDEEYDVYYVDYALKAGEKLATLSAVQMSTDADNADIAAIGTELKVPVFTQAVQQANMTGGKTEALNAAFGDSHPWTAGVPEDDGAADLYIRSADELFDFAKSVNEDKNNYSGKTVALANDIDLNGKQWTPVGNTGNTEFLGTFDGRGYTISNFYVDDSSYTDDAHENRGSGLFGWITSATVKNLTIENATIKGNKYVGGIVGYMQTIPTSIIENCHAIAVTVTHNDIGKEWSGHVGAIVGYSNNKGSVVKNCTATGCTVSSAKYSGPISGSTAIGTNTGNLENCTVSEAITTVAGLKTAIANGGVIVLSAGTYDVGTYHITSNKDFRLIGVGDVIIEGTIAPQSSAEMVFENLTFDTAADKYGVETTKAAEVDVTVRNCIFGGDGYGIYKNSPGKIEVENCTFNSLAVAIGSESTYSSMKIHGNTFDGCTEVLGLTGSELASGESETGIEADMIANNTGATTGNIKVY